MVKKIKIQKESFIQGIIAIMFSQVIIKVSGLIYKLYLTNKEGFGDEGNAIYSSGFQIYALLLTLSSIGVPNAISKLVSEKLAKGDTKGAHRVFKVAFVTFALIGLCGTSILFFGAHYIANKLLRIPEAELTLVALAPSIFFVAISSVIRGYFNGREQMSVSAKSQTIEQICKALLTIIIVGTIATISSSNTVLMAAGANLATTCATFLGFTYLFSYYRLKRKEVWQDINLSINRKNERIKTIIKNIMLVAIPISLSSMLVAISKNIDAFTVVRGLETFLTTMEAKLQYGILGGKVDTLTALPLSFNIAFAVALIPAISTAMTKRDINTAKKRISYSILLTILIGLPCTIGMIVFAEPILKLLFPNAASGVTVLQISSLTILFTMLEQTLNGALQGMGKLIVPIMGLGCGVIIKLILNIILIPIPEIGINGAAIASVVCHTISFCISFIVLNKYIKISLSLKKCIIKPIIATIIMVIFSWNIYIDLCNTSITCMLEINPQRVATIISIIMALIIYIICIILLKVLSKEELYMLPYGEKLYKILYKFRIYK